MATCDGGMLVLNDTVPENWAREASQLRNVRGTSEIIGENFRMDELRAAIGRVQLPKLEAMNDERRAIAARYNKGLADLSAIESIRPPDGHDHVYHWYVARLEASELDPKSEVLSRPLPGSNCNPTPSEAFASLMRDQGVDMPSHNRPVYLYEPFTLRGYGEGLCPVSERLWRDEIFRLPLNLDLTPTEIDHVLNAVHSAIARLN